MSSMTPPMLCSLLHRGGEWTCHWRRAIRRRPSMVWSIESWLAPMLCLAQSDDWSFTVHLYIVFYCHTICSMIIYGWYRIVFHLYIFVLYVCIYLYSFIWMFGKSWNDEPAVVIGKTRSVSLVSYWQCSKLMAESTEMPHGFSCWGLHSVFGLVVFGPMMPMVKVTIYTWCVNYTLRICSYPSPGWCLQMIYQCLISDSDMRDLYGVIVRISIIFYPDRSTGWWSYSVRLVFVGMFICMVFRWLALAQRNSPRWSVDNHPPQRCVSCFVGACSHGTCRGNWQRKELTTHPEVKDMAPVCFTYRSLLTCFDWWVLNLYRHHPTQKAIPRDVPRRPKATCLRGVWIIRFRLEIERRELRPVKLVG